MATAGAFGVKRVPYTSKAITCLECYRSWLDDVTPAGRCPWEYLHSRDRFRDVAGGARPLRVCGWHLRYGLTQTTYRKADK